MLGLGRLFGRTKASPPVDQRRLHAEAARMAKRILARYDAAQTTEEDRRYWSLVDNLSADAALSPEVRRTVRNRARYEAGNGGYCKGMVKQKANSLIGRGPRLQMLSGDEEHNAFLEAEWMRWSRATRFGKTLRTACRCKIRDGAALAILGNRPRLPTRAKIKLRLVDIDRLHTPDLMPMEKNRVDGIDFDADGDPEYYWILDEHPGSSQWSALPTATRYPASRIVHWFDEDRAEQHHGFSELAPSLRTFGNHRRFLKATIRAAEVAAEIAAFFTTSTPDDEENADYDRVPLDVLDLEFGQIMVAPKGDDVKTVKAEHPNTVFTEFNEQIVAEESRPLLMSSNVATGNFNKASYASSRSEMQIEEFNDAIDRDELEIEVVEPVFAEWLRETLSEISGIAPSDIDLAEYAHEWHWDHRGHVDPAKQSNSQDTDLRNGTLTHAAVYAQQNKDWRTEFKKSAESLGITLAEFQALVRDALYKRVQPAKPQKADDEIEEETTV